MVNQRAVNEDFLQTFAACIEEGDDVAIRSHILEANSFYSRCAGSIAPPTNTFKSNLNRLKKLVARNAEEIEDADPGELQALKGHLGIHKGTKPNGNGSNGKKRKSVPVRQRYRSNSR